MKKKFLTLILMIATILSCLFGLAACEEKKEENNEIVLKDGISFQTLAVDGKNVYGKVSNSTEIFSFNEEIIVRGKTEFVVAIDVYGDQQAPTKMIPLEVGDNIVYIMEMLDDELINTYTVTIRRRPIYEITFNVEGGTEVKSQLVEEDSFVSKPSTSRTGYTFKAWNYDFSQPVTDNLTIEASWTINTYRITYKLDGGKNAAENPKTYTIETETIVFEAPTKVGYEFTGWYADLNLETPTTEIINGSQGNRTLYARWEIIEYTIAYELNDGKNDESNPETYTIKTETIMLANPTRNGYTFMGWYTNSDFENQATKIIKGSYGSKTFYAQWEAIFVLTNNTITGLTSHGKTLLEIEVHSTIDNITIKEIGDSVFREANMSVVTIFDGITSIGNYAFTDSRLSSIKIPDSVNFIGEYCFNWCRNLTSVEVSENNVSYQSIDGDLYTEDKKTIIQYAIGKKATSFAIPDSVTVIGDYAFSLGDNLTSISIPKSVGIIGDSAFGMCANLTNLIIPNSITSIANRAFHACTRLTSIAIPDSVTAMGESVFADCDNLKSVLIGNKVKTLGYQTFLRCSSLENIEIGENVSSIGLYAFFNCTSLTSVILPSNVEKIGGYSFEGCKNLESVTIGNKVTSIELGAFSDCKSLSIVYYEGTVNDWKKINIGSWNTNLETATIYYYSALKPSTTANFWHYVDGVPTKW